MQISTPHNARARVQLTVEIEVTSNWGAGCSIQQVYEQAATEAKGAIRNALTKAEVPPGKINIIGEPLITAVIAPGRA